MFRDMTKKKYKQLSNELAEEPMDKVLEDLDITIWAGPISTMFEKSVRSNLLMLLEDYGFELKDE